MIMHEDRRRDDSTAVPCSGLFSGAIKLTRHNPILLANSKLAANEAATGSRHAADQSVAVHTWHALYVSQGACKNHSSAVSVHHLRDHAAVPWLL